MLHLSKKFRTGVQHALDQAVSVQDLGNIAGEIAKVAAIVFPVQKQGVTRYSNPILLSLGITNMWKQWALIKRTSSGRGLQSIIRRWKVWAAYFRQYRTYKTQCQERKKQYLRDKMAEAEIASRKHDLRSVYNIVRSLAPKAPRRRTQLKGNEGSLLSRTEEATLFCEHFEQKFTSTDAWRFDANLLYDSSETRDRSELQLVDAAQLQQDLLKAPLRKAVPPGHPPSATWRLRADLAATTIATTLNGSWTYGLISVPQGWSDAHLVLIKKPGKTGRDPNHHRPIGLQDQLGKITLKHILDPFLEDIQHMVKQFPQYGYVPGRGTTDALRRVYAHCHEVREACHGQSHSVLRRFHGQAPVPMVGGLQITVDLAGAFDAMPRQHLLAGLIGAGIPNKVIDVVMTWHQQAKYSIRHDDQDRQIEASQGVRQGCSVAPTLWLIYSHLISVKLAQAIGTTAAHELLSIFADDYHCSTKFTSLHQLESRLSHIGVLFRILRDLGMTISHPKSKATLVCRGKGAETIKRRFIRKTPQGRVLRFYFAQEAIDIPLVGQFVYLGAIASYGAFEDQTLEHRLQIGQANFWRLGRVLRSRHSLSKLHRLSIWRSCIQSASTYGLTSRGLTAKGAKKLTLATIRQVRLVLGDPVYMTRTSHAKVLEEWDLQHPITELKLRMLNEDNAEDDPYVQYSNNSWWQRAMDSLIVPSEDNLAQIPPHTQGVARPTCGVMYLNRTSMLIHMSKAHKQDPLRPVNQPAIFDKSRDAKDGLHICKHCDKPMCDWPSLRKHILDKRCPVLFNKAHSQHQTTLDDVGAAQAAPSTLTEVEVVPYAERPATVAALRRYGDNAAFHLPDRQVLAQYCALCNQWITSASKMKQHFRLSHAEVFQEFVRDACNLYSKFNSPGSPCPHCGSRSKVPRQHPFGVS